MKRFTEFGENEEEVENNSLNYEEDFETEQLTRITKLAGLNSTMQIYPKNNLPLMFKTQIGSLGKIAIYLKSKNLQEEESRTKEDEE